METYNRINSNPRRMNGEYCIRDLRLTVRRVVEACSLYPDRKELRREYPELEDEDIRQALTFAAASRINFHPAMNCRATENEVAARLNVFEIETQSRKDFDPHSPVF